MTSSLEWRKWWQQSQLQTVRRHTHFPLWAFMWLYIKHSWVLVRPGVFTQRWVLTLGTGCSSRAGASGAALLIGASGRNSERQTHCTGPLEPWISAQGLYALQYGSATVVRPELRAGHVAGNTRSCATCFFFDGKACKWNNRNICNAILIWWENQSFPRPKIYLQILLCSCSRDRIWEWAGRK